jgi:hypothetical protein
MKTYTWNEAIEYCKNLRLAGYDDWRLPTVKELLTLVDYDRFNPAINPMFGGVASYYWSSTTNVDDTSGAWYVDFSYGYVDGYGKPVSSYVRAVRTCGPCKSLESLFVDNGDGTITDTGTGLMWEKG